MICYLVRHGKDDDTVRGGWSNQTLTKEGEQQAAVLADRILSDPERFALTKIYSSDLPRAMDTARIIAAGLHLPVLPMPQFRETNNGNLAGMKNALALERYPGLFWNQMKWEECYPGGESPRQFYQRIRSAWEVFSEMLKQQEGNVLLVTHGGVIQVILSLIHDKPYSNTKPQRKIPHASMIALSCEHGRWLEL